MGALTGSDDLDIGGKYHQRRQQGGWTRRSPVPSATAPAGSLTKVGCTSTLTTHWHEQLHRCHQRSATGSCPERQWSPSDDSAIIDVQSAATSASPESRTSTSIGSSTAQTLKGTRTPSTSVRRSSTSAARNPRPRFQSRHAGFHRLGRWQTRFQCRIQSSGSNWDQAAISLPSTPAWRLVERLRQRDIGTHPRQCSPSAPRSCPTAKPSPGRAIPG